MKIYLVKDAHRDEVNKLLHLPTDERTGIISSDQTKLLINQNVLKEFCIEIPYQVKVGDWVKCVDEPTFDMSSFTPDARTIRNGTAWEKDKVFKVSGINWGGGIVEHGWDGTYLSWVRPMTDEEVEIHFEKKKQKEKFDKEKEEAFDSFMKGLKYNKYGRYYGHGFNR